ncbi:lipocalin family protein [Winogradskyella maritima]|uniref:Lipocalin family protein n=1 Tax=Winogradskyella maritima TaxID=1517766 RepID=A0ABV8ANC3_9FLAO|nr:lipocalin family protein [Winogradskyella maritima]
MRRLLIGLLCVSTLISCSKDPSEALAHINGYWSITEVTKADGNKMNYQFNETIDYISINDSLKGFRKKLKPSFNNQYSTSQDAESVTVKLENDSLNLYYSTPYNSWKETVLQADEKSLIVINQDGITYRYNRHESLKLDLDE